MRMLYEEDYFFATGDRDIARCYQGPRDGHQADWFNTRSEELHRGPTTALSRGQELYRGTVSLLEDLHHHLAHQWSVSRRRTRAWGCTSIKESLTKGLCLTDILHLAYKIPWTTWDQGKAYHQCFINADSQPVTAFITFWGLYEKVPFLFGLSNASAPFQRFMENCLGDLRVEIRLCPTLGRHHCLQVLPLMTTPTTQVISP